MRVALLLAVSFAAVLIIIEANASYFARRNALVAFVGFVDTGFLALAYRLL